MDKELIGTMYVARKPCGKISAAGWYDEKYTKDIAKSITRWIARGNTVSTIQRYRGDPEPEWCCKTGEQCACRTPSLPPEIHGFAARKI